MRHNEKRLLRIILDYFVLPIVSQWGTSFKKQQRLLHFLFASGVITVLLVCVCVWKGRRRPRQCPSFVQLGQRASPPMKTFGKLEQQIRNIFAADFIDVLQKNVEPVTSTLQ